MSYNDLFQIDATLVANEFLDTYMPSANGDYVKVYLYLLRNRINGVDVETIADRLELTEGDVRRAIRYWEKCGIVSVGSGRTAEGQADAPAGDGSVRPAGARSAGTKRGSVSGISASAARTSESGVLAGMVGDADAAGGRDTDMSDRRFAETETDGSIGKRAGGARKTKTAAASGMTSVPARTAVLSASGTGSTERGAAFAQGSGDSVSAQTVFLDENGEIRSRYRRTEGKEALNRLSEDDEFRQLLVIVQKYRSKILTETEQQVVAYLYDGLHMPADVLDYLVQYCVESNHNNMRYIEKTGLDWAESGIRTVRAARKRTRDFEQRKESAARKKAVSSDKAGITRKNDLDRWLNSEVKRSIQ